MKDNATVDENQTSYKIARVNAKTAAREATIETFNVTQSDFSNCSPVCRCLLPAVSVVTTVEFSTRSSVVNSTLENGSEVVSVGDDGGFAAGVV